MVLNDVNKPILKIHSTEYTKIREIAPCFYQIEIYVLKEYLDDYVILRKQKLVFVSLCNYYITSLH